MNRKNIKIQKILKPLLWSYNTEKIDLWKDRNLIITQGLNYGDWNTVEWLFKTYGKNEIKKIVSRPKRGLWWKKVLNFWLTIMEIKLPKKTFENAIIRIQPKF